MTKITVRENEILILSAPSSTGKSYLANKHFHATQILSSDVFRALIADDADTLTIPDKQPNDQDYARFEKIRTHHYREISEDAFDLLKKTLNKRAKHNRFTVIDATSLHMDDLKAYAEIAKNQHVPISILFLNIPQNEAFSFDKQREKPRGDARIKRQFQAMKRLTKEKKKLKQLGLREIFEVNEVTELSFAFESYQNTIPLEQGIDIFGDGHGLLHARLNLLETAGYIRGEDGLYRHPAGRKIMYVNDETSRGSLPDNRILYGEFPSIAMMVHMKHQVENELAYAVDSNHNYKIWRWLEGRNVKMAHGDEVVVEEFRAFEEKHGTERTIALKQELALFLKSLPSHLIIEDRGVERAVVTHAGIEDAMIGKRSHVIREFCRFGPSDGVEENGRPKRLDWTKDHKNGKLIIWGHVPHTEVKETNDTINVDTGGFCGHYLSALRYPEMDILQEKITTSFVEDDDNVILQAKEKEKESRFHLPKLAHFQQGFQAQTTFGTFSAPSKLVKEAIEFTSTRMAPIEEVFYVPPTMSPTPKTASLEDFLEHPKEAFDYFEGKGITDVILEKKHMGSRAYFTLFKTKEVGLAYYNRASLGSILTRNNAKFFKSAEEKLILEKLNHDLQPYFDEHNTDILVFDAEILPWNLKAKGLITEKFGITSNAAIHARKTHLDRLLEFEETRGMSQKEEIAEARKKLANAEKYHKAFTYYCWDTDVQKLEGIQIAPFHILTFSHTHHFDKTHVWHMEEAKKLSLLSDLLIPTEYKCVNLVDKEQVAEATQWWLDITEEGHEGLVMKPLDFIAYDQTGDIIQPAIKIRGREYLRIIYGMDYLEKEQLVILKKRSAGKKMQNALKEFKLSMESITRFIKKQPIEQIHACVLASLAYENEKLDPRL